MPVDLTNASAIVTGGASGLGAATARALAAGGASVAIVDLKNDPDLVADIGAHFIRADVTDVDAVREAVVEASSIAPLRVAVNCAGIGPAQRTLGRDGNPADLERFRTVIEVNLVGTYNMISQAASIMAAQEPLVDGERGVIVNTASVAAYEGQVGQAAYAASKGGIVGLTLPVARDLASVGIRCCAIAPGVIDTPLLDGITDEFREALAASVPFPKRLGTPDDFASLVKEIVRNGYLNGEVIRMDGALRMAPR